MLKIKNTGVWAGFRYPMIFLCPWKSACFPQFQLYCALSCVSPCSPCSVEQLGRVGFRGGVSSTKGWYGKWECAKRCASVSSIDVPATRYSAASGNHWQEEGWKDGCISCWYRHGLQRGLDCRYLYRHCKPYRTVTTALTLQTMLYSNNCMDLSGDHSAWEWWKEWHITISPEHGHLLFVGVLRIF